MARDKPATEAARSGIIDGLRGSSAIAVALFHFNEVQPALGDPYHRVLKHGWLGVTVFFVLSGFCIAAARAKDRLLPFVAKRLLRIYPAYWASLLVVLAVVAITVALSGVNDVTVLPKGIHAWTYTTLALAQPASAEPPMNWVYWSLAYEIAFYLIVGLVFTARRPWLIVLFSAAALTVVRWGYPFDHWGLFGLGVAAHLWTSRHRSLATLLALICCAHVSLALTPTEAGVALATSALILWPPPSRSLRLTKPLRWVGQVSYSLYLIHVPIGCYLLPRLLGSRLESSLALRIIEDVLLLTVCLLAAFVLYHTVEEPTHQFARKIHLRPPNRPLNPAQPPAVDEKEPSNRTPQ